MTERYSPAAWAERGAEIERLQSENTVMRRHLNLHPTMPLGDDLRQMLAEAATFLDRAAHDLYGTGWVVLADEMRAMAKRLRGEK